MLLSCKSEMQVRVRLNDPGAAHITDYLPAFYTAAPFETATLVHMGIVSNL